MSQRTQDLLVRGMGAARAKDFQEAQFYLEWVLREDSNQEQKLEAWFWLSEIADEPGKKRGYLEDILALEPHNQRARRSLALLDGHMDTRQSTTHSPVADVDISADIPPVALLQQGIEAVKEQHLPEARAYLTHLLKHPQGTREQKIQGWFWLSETCDTLIEKRRCLNAVLTLDPDNAVARRALSRLEDQTEALLPTPEQATVTERSPGTEPKPDRVNLAALTQTVISRTFPCPHCGDTLTFNPGKNAFLCAYCKYQRSLLEALRPEADIEDQAFIAQLFQLKGQARTVSIPTVMCPSCKVTFLRGATTCPYCSNTQLTPLPPQELLAPQGAFPFALSQKQAQQALADWLQREKVRAKSETLSLHPLYLPVWRFTIGGALTWYSSSKRLQEGAVATLAAGMISPTAAAFEAGKALASSDTQRGTEPIEHNDLLIPANHRLTPELLQGLSALALDEAVPVTPQIIQAGTVEIYQITLSNASLAARHQALERNRERLAARIRGVGSIDVQNISFSTADMAVEAYTLLLVPFWITTYAVQDVTYIVVVDAQSGIVYGQKPASGFKKLLGGLLGG